MHKCPCRLQGDHSGCSRGVVDIKTKVTFQWGAYSEKTFVLMSTKPAVGNNLNCHPVHVQILVSELPLHSRFSQPPVDTKTKVAIYYLGLVLKWNFYFNFNGRFGTWIDTLYKFSSTGRSREAALWGPATASSSASQTSPDTGRSTTSCESIGL